MSNASISRTSSTLTPTPTPASAPAPASPLPAIRRVVSGHSADGRSLVAADGAVAARPFGRAGSRFTDLFWTDASPADNGGPFRDAVRDHAAEVVSAHGCAFRAVDMPPGGGSPFHRTISLDFAIVTHGTVTCIFDDGAKVTLGPGDVLVQRGTIHAWQVEGDEWVRMHTFMLPAKPVKVERELGVEFHPRPRV